MVAAAGPLKILVVWPQWLWDTKQSPARRHYVHAVKKRPDVKLLVSGPGFPEWDKRIPSSENVARIMPGCQVIWGYKLGGTEKDPPVTDDRLARDCVLVETFNECWAGTDPSFPGFMHAGSGTVAKECLKARLTLAVIHHENDRPRLQEAAEQGVKVVHIPHCANPDFFSQLVPWEKRSGVLLTGVSGCHYPLRQRWLNLIKTGKLKARIFQRPPNYTASTEDSDRLVREYALALNHCRVKLGCSSRWRYALNHYTEAAMSGCVQVADLPEAAPPGFERMIYQVSPESSDRELLQSVSRAMEDSESLGGMARAAARAYTIDRYAENFVSAVRNCL